MISTRFRAIFVEIPKTGSTSIRHILGSPIVPHLSIWEIRRFMMSQISDGRSKQESLQRKLYSLLPRKTRSKLGAERFDHYFKFGFVRNPWDRAVSLYFRKNGPFQMKQEFDDFIRGMKYSSATCIHPSPHVNQLDWLVDPNGNLAVDYVGRFESLQEDWREICDKIGIKAIALPMKKMSPAKRGHYTTYYTQETRALIAERFHRDIEYFGYEFQSS